MTILMIAGAAVLGGYSLLMANGANERTPAHGNPYKTTATSGYVKAQRVVASLVMLGALALAYSA